MTKISLEHPVEVGGRTISTVEMRRPKVRDHMEIKDVKTPEEAELKLISSLVELPENELIEFDMADWGKLQDELKRMSEPGKPADQDEPTPG